MATDKRPYVVPRITDRGTILLLDDEQHEFHLSARDAAELGVQLLRSYAKTYGFTIFVPTQAVDGVTDSYGRRVSVSGNLDPDTLEIGQTGNLVARLHHHPVGRPGGSGRDESVFGKIREIVLRDVRSALGVRD